MSATARISGMFLGLFVLAAFVLGGVSLAAAGQSSAPTSNQAGLIWDTVPGTPTDTQP